jgi:hypothetical protein
MRSLPCADDSAVTDNLGAPLPPSNLTIRAQYEIFED